MFVFFSFKKTSIFPSIHSSTRESINPEIGATSLVGFFLVSLISKLNSGFSKLIRTNESVTLQASNLDELYVVNSINSPSIRTPEIKPIKDDLSHGILATEALTEKFSFLKLLHCIQI